MKKNSMYQKPSREYRLMMGYDDITVKLGQFGRYQRRIYLLLCLPAISCALHKLSGVFLQAKVKHRCELPVDTPNASYLVDDGLMDTWYPREGLKAHSSCLVYKSARNLTQNESVGFATNSTLHCSSWVYDTSMYSSTTLMEWDMVCDRAWLRATSDAMLMIGVMLGSIIFGDLSDRLGRKLIFFISLVLQVVFGVLVAVAPDVYSYMFARIVLGSTTSGVFLVAYVIALEMVGPKMRMVAGVVFQLFFSAGFILTAGFSYFVRDWRYLQIALTLPGIAFLSYWWFIPESVRWLLTKGRYEEAKEIIRKAAKENRKTISTVALQELSEEESQEKKGDPPSKPSILVLFKYPNLRKKSIIIFFLWFVNSGCYYGLSWNTSDLGGNQYINFVISGAVEVPAYCLLLATLNRWGRKMILAGSMIVAGTSLVLTVFVPEYMNWLTITLAMIGKLAITSSYGTVYVFSAEQFPTVIRNVGLGAGSTFARIGGILAPYFNIMAEVWKPLPMLEFGVLALVGGLLALLLPETLNKKLPDSIADGEQFGMNIITAEEAGEQMESLKPDTTS